MKNIYFFFSAIVMIPLMLFTACDVGGTEKVAAVDPGSVEIIKNWKKLAGEREGKVVYASPPNMIILDLGTGKKYQVPGVVVAGAPGRRKRGKSPRPFWAPDGKRFVYRYNGNIYVSDEQGNKISIENERMDRSDETRWSWFQENGVDWLAGPSKKGNVILVKVADPSVVRVAYGGGDVEDHCELTGSGKYVVYDDGRDIYVTRFGTNEKGIKISKGQSCRPCASPDDRAAWLRVPHTSYHIYSALDGKHQMDLNAPEGEELYRLNWSNHADFAAHMFGSQGNTKIQIRKVSTGEYLFIGYGWDPDLWVHSKKFP